MQVGIRCADKDKNHNLHVKSVVVHINYRFYNYFIKHLEYMHIDISLITIVARYADEYISQVNTVWRLQSLILCILFSLNLFFLHFKF